MESNKQTKAASAALDALDLRIKRLMELQDEAKALDKQIRALKDEFKHSGSVAGSVYAVRVSKVPKQIPLSKAELEAKLGPEGAREYLKDSESTYVTPFKLDGAQ